MLKKNVPGIILILCINAIISCNSQPTVQKNKKISWKQADFEKIHFKYPADWIFDKNEIDKKIFLTSTPDSLKFMDSLRAFEIIQIDPQGHSFAEFKKLFIGVVTARTYNELTVFNRKDTMFKSLETTYVQAGLFDKNDPTPAEIYAVNGIDRFYMITIIGLHKNYIVAPKIKQITAEIINSLTIDK